MDADVIVVEKAPREWSGGNSAFTAGAMRNVHAWSARARESSRSAKRPNRPGVVQVALSS